MAKRIAVIGAGPSGLACAYALQKKGHDVTVFEKKEVAGGRMRTYRQGEHSFNSGATMLIDHYTHFLSLCKELQIEGDLLFKPAGCKIKVGDRHYPITNDLFSLLKMGQIPLSSRFRLFLRLALSTALGGKNHFFSPVKPNHFLYRVSAKEFFFRYFDERMIQATVGTLCSSITLLGLDQIAFKNLLDALNFGRGSQVCFFVHGIDVFCKALATRLSVRYNGFVERIFPSGQKIDVLVGGGKEEFDRVVLAIPPQKILPVYPEALAFPAIQKASFIPTLRLAFLVPLLPFKEDDFVLFPTFESEIVTGANCSESLFKVGKERLTKESKGVLAVCVRSRKSKEWFEWEDEAIFAEVRRELCRLLPPFRQASDRIQNFHLERWESAVPGASPEQIAANNEFWKEGQGKNGVYLCGDFLNMMWVEGVIRCGEEIAERI